MTPATYTAALALIDQPVRITFTDGQEVLAHLVSLTTDPDGSQHLLYDHVTWHRLPHNDFGSGAFYSGGDEVTSLCAAPAEP